MIEELNGQFLGNFVCQQFFWCLGSRPRHQEKPEVVTNFSKIINFTVTEGIFQNLGICVNLNITL